jgi:hypothetical protein
MRGGYFTAMQKYKCKFRPGLTMIELMSATTIALIVIMAGVAFILVDTQKSWSKMYTLVHGDVVTGAYVAKSTFDSGVRKASSSGLAIDSQGNWVYVEYSSNPDSGTLDSYARFYSNQGNFIVDYGQLNPKELLDTQTICSNVTSCKFSQSGKSVQMALTLAKNGQSQTVTSAAYLHN